MDDVQAPTEAAVRGPATGVRSALSEMPEPKFQPGNRVRHILNPSYGIAPEMVVISSNNHYLPNEEVTWRYELRYWNKEGVIKTSHLLEFELEKIED